MGMSPYDRDSLTRGRKEIKSWHARYPSAAVLVVIEGHSVIDSGEVLWKTSSGKENFDCMPNVCPLLSTGN
jgi:hypothetical protein